MTKAKSRGQRWRDEMLAGYEWRPDERLILEEAAATVDAIDQATAVVEKRQQRLLLSRLVGQLAVPDGDGRPSMDGKSVRGRRASEARWRREREART
jgi:hypothetical protein